jgi:hypothetical protein
LPAPPDGSRDVVLSGSGYLGPMPHVRSSPATKVVIIDVAGLYEEEVFDDPVLAEAAAPLRDLAARGTRFEDCWTRYADWPVTEYQMLVGGFPAVPGLTAEDDPAQTVQPGAGLLAMPPPPGRVANKQAYDLWRVPTAFDGQSLFEAGKLLGFAVVLLGDLDFHWLHLNAPPRLTSPGILGDDLAKFGADNPGVIAVVALGGARTADRHDPKAIAELDTLAKTVADLTTRIPGALVALTSRGATPIEDDHRDFYGPGTSRHVPLVLVGPGVRAGVVSGQPASLADLPATVLYALGAGTTTDIATGTWTARTDPAFPAAVLLAPANATEGHVLLRAFGP